MEPGKNEVKKELLHDAVCFQWRFSASWFISKLPLCSEFLYPPFCIDSQIFVKFNNNHDRFYGYFGTKCRMHSWTGNSILYSNSFSDILLRLSISVGWKRFGIIFIRSLNIKIVDNRSKMEIDSNAVRGKTIDHRPIEDLAIFFLPIFSPI